MSEEQARLMDRVAQLAAEAGMCLWEEKWDFPKGWTDEERRADTRVHLANYAKKLGFSDNEISFRVDEALSEAGVLP